MAYTSLQNRAAGSCSHRRNDKKNIVTQLLKCFILVQLVVILLGTKELYVRL